MSGGMCGGEQKFNMRHIKFSTCLLPIKVPSQTHDCVHFKSIWKLQARDINVGIFSRQKGFKSMSLGEHEYRQKKGSIWGLNPGEPNIWRSRRTTSTNQRDWDGVATDHWRVRKPESVLFWKPREEIVSSKSITVHVKCCAELLEAGWDLTFVFRNGVGTGGHYLSSLVGIEVVKSLHRMNSRQEQSKWNEQE